MRFMNPGAAWWLLLALPIVLFYLLKLRRRRFVVPSTVLWARALEELEANAPLRRLRKSLLLLLQLLALLGLVAVLMRPLWRSEAEVAGRGVLVVDASASMGAREADGRSRLDAAKRRAANIADGLGSGDRLAIVEAGASSLVRSPMTGDRARLRAAIDAIQPTDSPGNLADAILLARELLRAEQGDRVLVLSDGGAEREGDGFATREGAADVRFIRVGETSDNAGMTAFTHRLDPADEGRRQLFVAAENFSDHPRSLNVELRLDGALRDLRQVSLETGERRGLIFDLGASESGMAEVRLASVGGDGPDALAADDVAYAYVPDARRLRVAAAVENVFLLRALTANPRLEVSRVPRDRPPPAGADLLACEGALPGGWARARAPLLALDPVTEDGLWRVDGTRDTGAVSAWDAEHPVNAYLNYADVRVARAPVVEAPRWLRPIARAGDTGLVWAGTDGDRRVAVLAFDLLESDLPLRVEFPLLLANATGWLAGSGGFDTPREAKAGQSIAVRAGGQRALVTRPDGGTDPIALVEGAGTYARADRVGLYRLETEGAGEVVEIGVSLLDAAESSIGPREVVGPPAAGPPTSGTGGARLAGAGGVEAEREIWPYVILPLVLLLLVEWVVYHRRLA
jgi:Ca-activated chloride channel family protein